MNIFNKVTWKTLMLNKVRTIVTIIGIILSASMVCAVTVTASSALQFVRDNTIAEHGNWFGNVAAIDDKQIDELVKDKNVENTYKGQSVGYAEFENSSHEEFRYLYITGVDDKFKENMPINLVSGRMPKNSNEIIMPEHIFNYENVKFNIGDKVTLKVGNRKVGDRVLGQNNEYQYDESLVDVQEKEYTIVGYYEKPAYEYQYAPGYTVITKAVDAKEYNGLYDLYFRYSKPSQFYKFLETNSNYIININDDLLMCYGQIGFARLGVTLITVSAIFIILIMFGSISLIYNAFSISVSERTKQFGLLSSIGATKKQLKKSVIFEAFAVSIIGIPIGIICGIGGMGVTFLCVGDKVAEMLFDTNSMPLRLSVSVISIVIAALISFITVFISAWIPSKRATRVSAIEAIRLNKDIKVKEKPVKANKLIYKLFGFEGMIGDKYYKRSRKKYRATVISLFMSVVLFISSGSFCKYLQSSLDMVNKESSCDIVGYLDLKSYNQKVNSNKTVEDIYNVIKSAKYVDKSAYYQNDHIEAVIPKQYINQKNYNDLSFANNSNVSEGMELSVGIFYIDDESYLKYLEKNNLDKSIYYNKQKPVALAYSDMNYMNQDTGVYEKFNMINSDSYVVKELGFKNIDGYQCQGFDYDDEKNEDYIRYVDLKDENNIIKMSEDEARAVINILNVGHVIDKKPYFLSSSSGKVDLIYPLSFKNTIESAKDSTELEDSTQFSKPYTLTFTSTNHNATFEDMKNLMNSVDDNLHVYLNMYDRAKDNEKNKNILLVVNVFSYGFITLITLIAVANVFNTISTNVILRRRDFAMLKSVGLTNKGLNKMLGFECILYGIRSLMFALPVSCGVTYLIFLSIRNSLEVDFTLPIGFMLISIVSVFIIVFLTMIYSIRKIKESNVVDELKNENI